MLGGIKCALQLRVISVSRTILMRGSRMQSCETPWWKARRIDPVWRWRPPSRSWIWGRARSTRNYLGPISASSRQSRLKESLKRWLCKIGPRCRRASWCRIELTSDQIRNRQVHDVRTTAETRADWAWTRMGARDSCRWTVSCRLWGPRARVEMALRTLPELTSIGLRGKVLQSLLWPNLSMGRCKEPRTSQRRSSRVQ